MGGTSFCLSPDMKSCVSSCLHFVPGTGADGSIHSTSASRPPGTPSTAPSATTTSRTFRRSSSSSSVGIPGDPEIKAKFVDYLKFCDKYKDDVRAHASTIHNSFMKPLNLFYGFSGPTERQGSFADWAILVGAHLGYCVVTCMADIVNGVNLADSLIWDQHLAQLGPGGTYDGSLYSPPCGTFSRARKEGDGGPPPLRGTHGPELLGLDNLDPKDKEKVRTGTLLAVRTAEGIKAQGAARRPWVFENPPERGDAPSIYRVPQVLEQMEEQKAHSKIVAQCNLTADAVKRTEFRSDFEICQDVPDRCNHQRVWWRLPPHGRWLRAAHPPLVGKHRAVRPEVWEQMTPLERSRSEGEFLTRNAAHYPSMVNCYLACLLVPQAIAAKAANSLYRTGDWMNRLVRQPSHLGIVRRASASGLDGRDSMTAETEALVDDVCRPKRKPDFLDPLRIQAQVNKEKENDMAIGGLRRPQWSLTKLGAVAEFGRKARAFWDKFLDMHPDIEQVCVDAVVKDNELNDPGPDQEQLGRSRAAFAEFLGVTDLGPVSEGDFSTEIWAGLLEGWRCAAKDPDWAACEWLRRSGVPAGIIHQPPDCGIFPKVPPDMLFEGDLEEYGLDTQPFESVEEDEEAWQEVMRLTDKKWLKRFPSLNAATSFLGRRPVLSRFGLVVKTKKGKTKKRLILDGTSSGVSKKATKGQRIILPKLLDVVYDILNLMATGKDVELFICDFADAFWLLPLSPDERMYFVAELRKHFFVFLRCAQGSRNAPLGWGRVAALLARLTQSMFDKNEVRMEVYTDDPCMALAGTPAQRRRFVAIIVLTWRTLGFPLSWKKAVLGTRADWIGGNFDIDNDLKEVTVKIKDDLFEDAKDGVLGHLENNVISVKHLRSTTGKLCNIANLLVAWRPFLGPMYGALYSKELTGAPPGCIWTKQLARPLNWFRTFFASSGGMVRRTFRLATFMATEGQLEIIIDASPWGLAGLLTVNGEVEEYFADPLGPFDFELYGHVAGSADGQQVWESLAALTALRLWKSRWADKAVRLRLKGDSVTMLSLVINMRPSSPGLAIIGQELALDFASVSFMPIVAQHLPGVANVSADTLSRWFQPGVRPEVPPLLADALHRQVPTRDRSFYLTISDMISDLPNKV